MDSYIPKPFNPQQLITGIAQVLNITLKVKKDDEPTVQKIHPSGITDLTYLDKFCEGDIIRMNKYIRMFTSTAPGLIEKINSALATNDFLDIANQVHGYKTKWMMMGMTETKDLAIRLEHLCRDGSEEKLIRETIRVLFNNVELALIELSR